MPQKITIISFIFFLVLPLIQLANAEEKDLPSLFRNEWKPQAEAVLERHLLENPKCELSPTLDTLRKLRIHFSFMVDPSIRAYVLPNKEEQFPIVFINFNWKWDERQASVVLIHEATHLTLTKKGRWMCGPDLRERLDPAPSCRLFGKIQVNSDDLDRDLEEHLEKDLNIILGGK